MLEYNKKIKVIFLWILLTLIFGLSYTQLPLFSSNQNTHFLHGLAEGGLGFLHQDWLANTTDAFPLFSALVQVSYENFPKSIFYLYYVILIGVYVFSILGIIQETYRTTGSAKKYSLYFNFVIITLLHSAIFRYLSLESGLYLGWSIQSGVAGQHLLGPVFQPSTFGVFLILSIYLFLRGKAFLAVVCLSLAASFHATYLLAAGVLTATYMVLLFKENKEIKTTILVGLLALILVLPSAIYAYLSFSPTSPEIINEARHILVNYRLPHHANVSQWLNKGVLYQLIILLAALYLVRRSKVFTILSLSLLAVTLLTVLQVVTANHFLALLFPWRISVFLVPISTCLIVGYLISLITNKLIQRQARIKTIIFALVTILLLALPLSGIVIMQKHLNSWASEPDFSSRELSMIKYVSDAKVPEDIYLIPPTMENFRISAGVPVFIDWKSLPYSDKEVIEWYSRLKIANDFYGSTNQTACNKLKAITSTYGVTHVLVDRNPMIECDFADLVHQSNGYRIYKLNLTQLESNGRSQRY